MTVRKAGVADVCVCVCECTLNAINVAFVWSPLLGSSQRVCLLMSLSLSLSVAVYAVLKPSKSKLICCDVPHTHTHTAPRPLYLCAQRLSFCVCHKKKKKHTLIQFVWPLFFRQELATTVEQFPLVFIAQLDLVFYMHVAFPKPFHLPKEKKTGYECLIGQLVIN